MVAPLIETETKLSLSPEQVGLLVTRERVDIGSLVLPDILKTRFPKEYDPANIKELATTIQSGILTPHALAVKEIRDTNGSSHVELLHKPSVIFALQNCGISDVDVVIIHNKDDFDLFTATNNQLLCLGEQGVLTNHIVRDIPMADVVSDESIIDEEYRDVLKSQLSTGQEVNIRVRVRRIGERIVYDIIDGYHRHDSLKIIGAQLISARLTFGMTDEELHDERVLAAFRSAKAVKFSRMIMAMQLSYSESVWNKQYNLKLSQILSWAVNAKKTKQPGKNLGVPEEVARQAIDWVTKKAILWNSDVGTLLMEMRAAENSFPEIIKQIRTTEGGGHAGDGMLNRDKFIAMVDPLRNKLFLQSTMVSIIKDHNLNSDQTRVVASVLACIENQPDLMRLLQFNPFDTDVLSSILKQRVTIEKGKFVVQDLQRQPQDAGDEEPLVSHLDELAPIDTVVQEAESSTIFNAPTDESPREEAEPEDEDGDDVLPAELHPVEPLWKAKDDGHPQDYNKVRSPGDYEREITELQATLEKVNGQLARGGKSKSAWYETVATLTLEERDVMRSITKLKKKGMDIGMINTQLRLQFGLTHNQLAQLKRSAVSKWSVFLSDMLQKEYDQIVG